jgi:hypothetical protein
MDHMTMNVGQPTVNAVLPNGQLLVIDPKQMKDRGMQVVTPRLALDCLIAPIIAGAIGNAGPNPCTP